MSSAFAENHNSVRNTCVQNINSVVVVDGVCESMFGGDINTSCCLHQHYWPIRPLCLFYAVIELMNFECKDTVVGCSDILVTIAKTVNRRKGKCKQSFTHLVCVDCYISHIVIGFALCELCMICIL